MFSRIGRVLSGEHSLLESLGWLWNNVKDQFKK